MDAVPIPLLVAVVPAVISTLIGGVVAPPIADSIIDRYRSQDTRELETLKSEQRRLESKLFARYSLLQSKRAEAIVDLYSSVYDLQTTLQTLLNPDVADGDERFRDEKLRELEAVKNASTGFIAWRARARSIFSTTSSRILRK